MRDLTDVDLEALTEIVGPERISTGKSQLELHSQDESFHEKCSPKAVIWPLEADEISQVLRLANGRMIPVTPWAAGTSLEGNPIPVEGGIVLDMRLMDKILKIRPEDLQATVQPGLDFHKLNRRLKRYGLFFSPDPGATATIGGMVANNAKGIRAMKYGTTGDHVLELEVVLPSGEIIRTGSRATVSSSGYDLKRLFIGSEGTLGVITEVALSLAGLPGEFMAAVGSFASIKDATNAVARMVQFGLAPAALEFLDEDVIKLINRFEKLELREKPTIFMEFQGSSKAALEEDLELVKEISSEANRLNFDSGIGRERRDLLWKARYAVHDTIRKAYPGISVIVADVAVPISKYSEMVALAKEAVRAQGLPGFAFGHAGSGSLHVEILFHPENQGEGAQAQEANERIASHALLLRGTTTGEHGVGLGKRKFMEQEHGASLEVMKQIKKLLDPNNIMNPGKIFP